MNIRELFNKYNFDGNIKGVTIVDADNPISNILYRATDPYFAQIEFDIRPNADLCNVEYYSLINGDLEVWIK